MISWAKWASEPDEPVSQMSQWARWASEPVSETSLGYRVSVLRENDVINWKNLCYINLKSPGCDKLTSTMPRQIWPIQLNWLNQFDDVLYWRYKERELASSVSWTALVEEVTLNAIANVF